MQPNRPAYEKNQFLSDQTMKQPKYAGEEADMSDLHRRIAQQNREMDELNAQKKPRGHGFQKAADHIQPKSR